MSYLVTGAHSGFGKELCSFLSPTAVGLSRKTGHDISIPEDRQKIASLSLEHDVFVNFAHTDFNQTKLLYLVGDLWTKRQKSGHIFNIGSYSTYYSGEQFKPWIISKFSLDLANKQFCKAIENNQLPFRMTLLRVGLLNCEKNRLKDDWKGDGHKPEELASLIKWTQTQPKELSINELSVHWVAKNNIK